MKLAEAGATTVIISPRQARRIAIVLGPWHNDVAVRLAQAARVTDDAWCRNWALGLVRAKLARQCRALRTLQVARPDARKPLLGALQALESSVRDLPADANAAGDPGTLPDLASLRGREGAAARAYFAGLTAVMPPALQFTGRNRRPPRDPVNVCLSLGYTLLQAQAIQACASAGLDPLLGFYHRPAFGRESLACDLIDPLRPAVDLWVWEQLRTRTLREEHFSPVQGACLLGKVGRSIFYRNWELANRPLRRWLRAQSHALARELRHQGNALLLQDPLQGEEPWE